MAAGAAPTPSRRGRETPALRIALPRPKPAASYRVRLGELIEPLRRIPRSELRRLLIPAARLVRIGRDADGAEAPEDQRIEGSTERKRRLRIAALGGAAKREACGGDIAIGEKGAAARKQGRDVLDCRSSAPPLAAERSRSRPRRVPAAAAAPHGPRRGHSRESRSAGGRGLAALARRDRDPHPRRPWHRREQLRPIDRRRLIRRPQQVGLVGRRRPEAGKRPA